MSIILVCLIVFLTNELFSRKMTIMSEIDNPLAGSGDAHFTASPLLDAIVHIMGNGLATLSGYTQLLQRAISTQALVVDAPELKEYQPQKERWLSYLQVMRERETLLNDFLNQLRNVSQEATQGCFHQHLSCVDLVRLFERIVECTATLHQDRTIQMHSSVQPLYVLCDPLWMELVLAHIVGHTVEAHTLSTAVEVGIKRDDSPTTLLQEARIEIRINSGLLRHKSGPEESFALWSQTLHASEVEICSTLCREVLHEYGGRIWIERAGDQEEIVSLALPLTK